MTEFKDTENSLLDISLKEANQYANKGYEISSSRIKLLEETIATISLKIKKDIDQLNNNNNIKNSGIVNSLGTQLNTIIQNFQKVPQKLEMDLNKLSKTNFSITLFGRTMAGKSTMMEILTHGNGDSIGKGAQRTTRDIRTYTYKNMTVTDVPGIAAFEGEDDEIIAFNEAKKSDLILFLLTDDAPQASEAECLSKIISLGKPVICIINSKVNIDKNTSFKLFTRDIEKKMKLERLETIKSQFMEFSKIYGFPTNIPFVYVHLKSAYLSQQEDWKELSSQLREISQFEILEKYIIKEVEKNGRFYKLKSFTDIVLVPIIDVFETLCEQAVENSYQGRIIIQNKKTLEIWTNNFHESSMERINNFTKSIIEDLKSEAEFFIENNYNNSNIDKEWRNIIKNQNIESKAEDLLNELMKDCNLKLQRLYDQLCSDLKFSHTTFDDKSLKSSYIIDTKRIFNWSTRLLNTGLIIASFFAKTASLRTATLIPTLMVSSTNPIGIALSAITIIQVIGERFFTDKEKKIKKTKDKLRKEINNSLVNLENNLHSNMISTFNQEIIDKLIKPTIYELNKSINSIFKLSDRQWDLSKTLNSSLFNINMLVFKEALSYIGHKEIENIATNIVRIPGKNMIILLENNTYFPNNAKKDLKHLFKEEINFIYNKNKKSILSQTLGKTFNRDNIKIEYIDGQPRIAHIENLGILDTKRLNRLRLGQQLTELLIMK